MIIIEEIYLQIIYIWLDGSIDVFELWNEVVIIIHIRNIPLYTHSKIEELSTVQSRDCGFKLKFNWTHQGYESLYNYEKE